MSLLTGVIAFIIFIAIIMAIFWIGIYVVLPIVLFFVLVSAIVSLIGGFVPSKNKEKAKFSHQKTMKNQIIDVEYEEIK